MGKKTINCTGNRAHFGGIIILKQVIFFREPVRYMHRTNRILIKYLYFLVLTVREGSIQISLKSGEFFTEGGGVNHSNEIMRFEPKTLQTDANALKHENK